MSTAALLDVLRSRGSPFAGLDLCQATGFSHPHDVHGPVFDQDVWDFRDVIGLPISLRPSERRMDFTHINNPRWRTVAKEYVTALMIPGHEAVRVLPHAYRTPRTLRTCVVKFRHVARWLNWLTDRGVSRLDRVTDQHCEAYLEERSYLRDKHGRPLRESKANRHVAAEAISGLAQYRPLFSTDRYAAGLRPFGGRTAWTIAGRTRNRENATPVVPATILQPMLAAALFMLDELSPHIVELNRQILQRRRLRTRSARGQNVDTSALRQAIERHIIEGRPLERLIGPWSAARASGASLDNADPLRDVALNPLARQAGYRQFD